MAQNKNNEQPAELSVKKVKVKFNFDTLISAYQKRTVTLMGVKDVETDDFQANFVAKRGTIHEVDEKLADQFLNDLILVPRGTGKGTTQRNSIDDFERPKYVQRAVLV